MPIYFDDCSMRSNGLFLQYLMHV
uniref:BLTX663 n=1 Tax=Nephila pilipes TaxID=299642 RepID=A0A076L0S3_NEPPI|nr:BLTX663 [Nephila pilipes]